MTGREITYRDWLKEWLEQQEGRVKESTRANYSVAVMNHILPALGDCTLEELTEEKLQETVLYWMREGRLDGKGGLSGKTAKDLAGVVRASLRAARRHYKLPPQDIALRYPGVQREVVEALSPAQQKRLVSAALAGETGETAGILLALYAGLRIGEVCALRWADIDLRANVLHVRRTVQRIFYKEWDGKSRSRVSVSVPKTHSSVRDVPLAPFLASFLRAVRGGSGGEAYVLTGNEKCLEPKTYRAWYQRFLERCGLPQVHFHALRHTFATRCISQGTDYKTVSALLGHASVGITLDLYVHPQMAQKRKCVERLALYGVPKTAQCS